MINDNTTEKINKLISEENNKKVSCYEETIWDDWDDKEVDELYGEMYRQLR